MHVQPSVKRVVAITLETLMGALDTAELALSTSPILLLACSSQSSVQWTIRRACHISPRRRMLLTCDIPISSSAQVYPVFICRWRRTRGCGCTARCRTRKNIWNKLRLPDFGVICRWPRTRGCGCMARCRTRGDTWRTSSRPPSLGQSWMWMWSCLGSPTCRCPVVKVLRALKALELSLLLQAAQAPMVLPACTAPCITSAILLCYT